MNFSQLGFGFFVLKINGIFLAIIFCIAAWLFYKKLEKDGLDTDYFSHHLWRWVVSGVVIGRLFALIFDPQIITNHNIFHFFAFWEGGVSFYGTLIGALGLMFYDLKKSKHDSWKWLDLSVPYLLIIACLSNIAAFLTGAVYGTETSLPWGVQYETFGVDTIAPVHPVTIYAFIVNLMLLNWTLKYGKNFYRQKGKLFLITGIIFFVADFLLKFLKGNDSLMIFNIISVEQLLSIVLAGLLTIYLQKREIFTKT